MKLQIRYKENFHPLVHAACLSSGDLSQWLKEINTWNIREDELECYVLPSSMKSLEPAGLFVIFKDPARANQFQLQDPYTCIEHSLFIPCNAEIIPQIHRAELKNILLWNKQIVHPVIGLIGFESKDKINLSDLFIYDKPFQKDWSFANPGLSSRPPFSEIKIIQPSATELINSIKEEVGQKSIENIPKNKNDKQSPLGKFADKIRLGLYKGVFRLLQAGSNALPPHDNTTNSEEGGMIQKLQQWLIKNIDELEKRRQEEIRRLLDLFDENSNEALQYAIPLDSPYLKRGRETSSWRLTKNPVQFNLGKLGGGRIVDSWDIGNYYMDLRTKYLNAAKREIEKKDFKKAAYIYAHLLGDFYSAANTLQQGEFYREASALYKDHLKNIAAAAECLEKGGLYIEAIELNKELKRDEKIGDLYTIIDQKENAAPFYEKHIEAKLSVNDHLDAARVIDGKLEQKERAERILLEGWNQSYQHEACLKKYFDLVLESKADTANAKINSIYSSLTPRHKRLPLLNVLEYVSNKTNDEELAETSKEILYEIVYEEAKSGNIQAVHNIKRFLPKDKLIGSDTSRYVNNYRNQFVRSSNPVSFQLDPGIKWIKAAWHRNQFLVIGIKNQMLQLARVNWYGNFEYYSWTNSIKQNSRFNFISSPYVTNHVLIHSHDNLPVTIKNLPKNKYFPEALIVHSPIWLHKRFPQVTFSAENEICELTIENGNINLHFYTLSGDLKRSVPCKLEGEAFSLAYNHSNHTLASSDGFYYAFREKYFLVISETGFAKSFPFSTLIRFFSSSLSFADFRIIISTNTGCIICKPSGGELNPRGGFFAGDLIPMSISFVQTDRFVIAEKKKAYLFEIRDEVPNLIQQYETHSAIVDILPTSSRHQFAVVEENGKIAICEINR